ELAGRPFIDLVHPDQRPIVGEAIGALVERRGKHEPIELRVIRKDGRAEWALWNAWAQEGDRCVYGILHDLSAARHLEDQLREEIKFNSTLLDTSPTFFVAISSDGKTLMMNQFMRTALGYTEEEVVGHDYMTMFVPERDREMLGAIFATLSQQRVTTLNEN